MDDETGEPLVQRPDDKPDSVRTRLAAYDKVRDSFVQFNEFYQRCIPDFRCGACYFDESNLLCAPTLNFLLQVTAPLVNYYSENGVLESFHGTMSDVIYPQVKQWLEEKLY